MMTKISTNKAKNLLNRNALLYKTTKCIQYHLKKIFIGYRNFSDIPGRTHFNDQSLVKGNIRHYKKVGESAVRLMESALRQSDTVLHENSNILDFPCGYGRVLRHIRQIFPQSRIYGGDIDQKALDFCEKEFHIITVQSDTNFKKVKFPVFFDLIWVGSLCTHIDSRDFRSLLETLITALKKRGILVFTTHGKESMNRLDSYGLGPVDVDSVQKELEKTGFVFRPYPGQTHYGISLCSREYVMDTIHQILGNKAKLIFYKIQGWDKHQDVFAYQKISSIVNDGF
ncbi:MAG: methyltransferase domain-containing protein [Candidatus Aminicenantes bacterium]|nr:methyltransferase domain-containing protein [Candidatus Aminicenantes bacterium]